MFGKRFLILTASEAMRQPIAHGGWTGTVSVEHTILMEFELHQRTV